VGTLRQQISSDLNMPRDNVTLSKDQKLVSMCIRYKQHTTDIGIEPGLELQLQLLSKTPEQFKDLSNNKLRLKQAGVQHGDMVRAKSKALPADVPHPLPQSSYGFSLHQLQTYVLHCSSVQETLVLLQIYMQYPFERTVQSVVKKPVFEGRGFGAKMTVEQLIAKQTRIERWESA